MITQSKPIIFSYDTLVHAIAGGCGAAVAMSVFYPLDILRTKQQLETSGSISETIVQLYEKDGIESFYRGLVPVIQSLFCSNFVYFYSFHGLKRISGESGTVKDLLLGIIAGSINVLTTTPLWVVNTRIKTQGNFSDVPVEQYDGLLDGLAKISSSEGLSALWSGTLSSLLLVGNPAIQFMIYEALKRSSSSPFSALQTFLAGAIAKASATVITYPLQLVQTKQRIERKKKSGNVPGIIQLWKSIIRDSGAKGLYRGMETKILQTVLTAALMFVCYEKIRVIVFALMLGRKRS